MPSTSHHLVHANIAVMRYPLEHPQMKDFLELADIIDEIAILAPGYISQPSPPDEGAIFKDPELLNLSIWESVRRIRNFTLAATHAEALKRRAEWFSQKQQYNYVLYWEAAGHTPLEREVMQHLAYLREHGPTPFAFTFDTSFSVEEALSYLPK